MSLPTKSLRLLMPQWQGGNNPVYHIGARLLSWLAPTDSDFDLVEVPVDLPEEHPLEQEEGIIGKAAIIRQNRAALAIIEEANPERIVTFGGDCSVSLAPFSYLAAKHAGDVAVLWIDAHFDLASSKVSSHAHSYPMLNLLGEGDPEFAAFARVPIPAARLAYVGIDKNKISERSRLAVEAFKPRVFSPDKLTGSFVEVADWVRETGASKLLVHFDLDVIDPRQFRAQLFNNPAGLAEQFKASPTGTMSFETVVGLLIAVGKVTDIIALTLAEHLPWDAENLRKTLARLPILSG